MRLRRWSSVLAEGEQALRGVGGAAGLARSRLGREPLHLAQVKSQPAGDLAVIQPGVAQLRDTPHDARAAPGRTHGHDDALAAVDAHHDGGGRGPGQRHERMFLGQGSRHVHRQPAEVVQEAVDFRLGDAGGGEGINQRGDRLPPCA